jgi:hypothetical protein
MCDDHVRSILSISASLLVASILVCGASAAVAQSVPEVQPTGVLAPEPREPPGAYLFGFYFDADDGRALLGLSAGPNPGRVLVFTRGENGEWLPDGSIPNPNPTPADGFGTGLALDGNFALVRSSEQDGSYDLFKDRAAGWARVQNVRNPRETGFNNQLQFVNGIAAIGALGGPIPGRVYTYRLQGNRLRLMDVVEASDGTVGDNFGYRVALSPTGKTLVAAAARPENEWIGSVYVFRRHGKKWVEQQKLEIGLPIALFGEGLATTDDLLIVGASGEGGGRGAAYLYRREHRQWLLQQRVQPGDELPVGADPFAFGNAIAIGSGRAVIGAHFSTRGLALVYRLSEAGLVPEFSTQGATFLSEYVDIESNTVMISSPAEAVVHLYELND